MQVVVVLAVLVVSQSAIWVYFEACRIRDAKEIGLGPDGTPAHVWGALVFLFWPIALPVFLAARRRSEMVELRFGPPPLTVVEGLTAWGIGGLVLGLAGAIACAIFGQWAYVAPALAFAGAAAFGGRRAEQRATDSVSLSGPEGFAQIGFRPLTATVAEEHDEDVVYQLDRPGASTAAPRPAAGASLPAIEFAAPIFQPPVASAPLNQAPNPVPAPAPARPEQRVDVRPPIAELRVAETQKLDVRLAPRRPEGRPDPRMTLAVDDASVLFEVVEADDAPPIPARLDQKTLALPELRLTPAANPLPAPPAPPPVAGPPPPPVAPTLASPLPVALPPAPPSAPIAPATVLPPGPARPPAAPTLPPRSARPAGTPSSAPVGLSYVAVAAPERDPRVWLWIALIAAVVLLGVLLWLGRENGESAEDAVEESASAPGQAAPEQAAPRQAAPRQAAPGPAVTDSAAPAAAPVDEETVRLAAMEQWMGEYQQMVGPFGRQIEAIDFAGFSADACQLLGDTVEQARLLPTAPDASVENRVRPCLIQAEFLVDTCRSGNANSWSATILEVKGCFHAAQMFVESVYQLPGLLEFDMSPGNIRSTDSMSGRYLEEKAQSGEPE